MLLPDHYSNPTVVVKGCGVQDAINGCVMKHGIECQQQLYPYASM
jgi:hypothetical protein